MSKQINFYLIGKLWKLARSENPSLFVRELNRSDIMEQCRNWNSFELSIMVYSFNKLNLGNEKTWERFQALYLSKDRDMSLKDHVMCGWAFIKRNASEDVKGKLSRNIMRNWMEIKNVQSEQSNLGLISYIFSQNGIKDESLWKKLSWLVGDTIEYQDEKNLTLVIYSFSRELYDDGTFWKNVERHLWNKNFDEFSHKHKMMIIFSFAKVNQGSAQFWKKIELYVDSLEILTQQDINFACWALGKAKIPNHTLWRKLLTSINPELANLMDYDVIIWGITQAFQADDTQHAKDIWAIFLSLDYPQRYSNNALTEYHSILYIAGQLIIHKFTHAKLFLEIVKRFKLLVHQNSREFVDLKKRLYMFKEFIEADPSIYNDHFHKLVFEKIKKENQNFALQYICDGVLLCEPEQIDIKYSLDYVEELMKIDNSSKRSLIKIYATTLIKLVERLMKHGYAEEVRKLSGLIEKDYVLDYISEKSFISHYALKVFLQEKDARFYTNFLSYLKKRKKLPRPLFVRFLLTSLHKHNCYLPTNFTQQFNADANYLYQLNCEDVASKEGLECFNYLVDSLVSLLKAPQMSHAELKAKFVEYFESYLDFDSYIKEATGNPDEEVRGISGTLGEQTKNRQEKYKNRDEEYDHKNVPVNHDFIEKQLSYRIEKFFIR